MERLPDWSPVTWDWIQTEVESRNFEVQEFNPSECHFPEPM
jgi:hypothetical protein